MQTHRAALFLDKGGVGKTTGTAHLGVALSDQGFNVLLIDLAGKQNDLAKHFGLWNAIEAEEERWPNISTVLSEDWATIRQKLPDAVDEMIWSTDEGPDIIPAHEGLDQVDDELASIPVPERYQFVQRFIDEDVDGYDVVLIDLPGLTNNVTINGLFAARRIVAPVELGPFEEAQMSVLLEDIEEINDAFDADIEVAMLMPNRVDGRTKIADQLVEDLTEEHPDVIAPEAIPKSQAIKNAQTQGTTLYDLDTPSNTADRARNAYNQNAKELITRLNS